MEREQRHQHLKQGLSSVFPGAGDRAGPAFAMAIVNGDGSTNYGGAWDETPSPIVRRISDLLGEAAYSRPAAGFGAQPTQERLAAAFSLNGVPPRGFVLAISTGNDVELVGDVRKCTEAEWRSIGGRLEEIQSGLKHWQGRAERQRG